MTGSARTAILFADCGLLGFCEAATHDGTTP